ncbi:MAG: hypothetical protein LBC75_00150 [Fibromonadaceae bacterium]|jgi:hypothetical protein|nr:hypothetical protein [Fibromonadaceae bacterium]
MNRIFSWAAMLCIAMLFSCTEVQRDNPWDEHGTNYKGSSSSDKPSSSSSARVSSSSSKPSSSSYAAVLSSSSTPSSSSSPYRLVCEVTVDTGIADESIYEYDMPEVICIENKSKYEFILEPEYDFQWINAPNWDAPKVGTYSKIQVKVNNDAEVCQGLTATCSGTLTILKGISSSSSTPRSSSSTKVSSSSSELRSSSSKTSSGGGGTCASTETRGDMCLWNAGGDCWPLFGSDDTKRSNCAQNGWIFEGGVEGDGTGCIGGTFICGRDNNPPKGSVPSIGCCHWENKDCYDIYTEDDKNKCIAEENKFWDTQCPDKFGSCPNK